MYELSQPLLMSDAITITITMDVIIYPCPNLDVCLGNIGLLKR